MIVMSPRLRQRRPSFRGLLDLYPGAAAAYSLRPLSAAWRNQPVVRVRRSNDDAEADFTAAEVADGTLTGWTGANDGFVVTWYDQSGNSRNATQATPANQPRIVEGGVLDQNPDSKAGIFSASGDLFLSVSDNGLFRAVESMQAHCYNTVTAVITSNIRRPWLFSNTPAGGNITRFEGCYRDNQFEIAGRRLDEQSFVRRTGGEPIINQANVLSLAAVHAHDRAILWANGNKIIDADFQGQGATSDTNSQRITIGGVAGAAQPWVGYISELIIFTDTFSDSIIEGVHNKIRGYYA
jgi:hypothetical protein